MRIGGKRKPQSVTAAILVKDGKILIAKRRASGKLPGVWEFPGGKLENNETARQCLKREMREELGIDVTVGGAFGETVYHYEYGSIRLLAFWVRWKSGTLRVRDHTEFRWVSAGQLVEHDFAPADIAFVKKLQQKEINVERHLNPGY